MSTMITPKRPLCFVPFDIVLLLFCTIQHCLIHVLFRRTLFDSCCVPPDIIWLMFCIAWHCLTNFLYRPTLFESCLVPLTFFTHVLYTLTFFTHVFYRLTLLDYVFYRLTLFSSCFVLPDSGFVTPNIVFVPPDQWTIDTSRTARILKCHDWYWSYVKWGSKKRRSCLLVELACTGSDRYQQGYPV